MVTSKLEKILGYGAMTLGGSSLFAAIIDYNSAQHNPIIYDLLSISPLLMFGGILLYFNGIEKEETYKLKKD